MMKITLFFSFLTLATFANASEDKLDDLKKLREIKFYEINLKYSQALERLKVEYTKAGNLEQAIEVKDELDRIVKVLKETKVNKKTEKKNSRYKLTTFQDKWLKFSLSASSTRGYNLGSLSKGQIVELKYQSGSWSAYPEWKTENPFKTNRKQHKIIIIRKDLIKSSKDKIDLSKAHFYNKSLANSGSYRIEENGDYIIRIGDDLIQSNRGSITFLYKIK